MKVGFFTSLYYLLLLALCVAIKLNQTGTYHIYQNLNLRLTTWFFVGGSVVLKIVFGLFGKILRIIDSFLFILDMGISVLAILGVYFYFESFLPIDLYSYAPIVIIAIANLFSSAFTFTMTTLYKSRSKTYHYIVGMFFMVLMNCGITIGFYFGWRSSIIVTLNQYLIIGLVFFLYDIYFAIDAYLIVSVRKYRYFENDSIFGFYSFYVDWFSYFWIDMFKTAKKGIKQRRTYKIGDMAR